MSLIDLSTVRDVLADRATLDVLGLVAGSLVAGSGLPKVFARLRERREGRAAFCRADLLRDGAQAAGNLLWVTVGASLGLISITFFCAIQATLMGLLIGLNLQARRQTTARGELWATVHGLYLPAPASHDLWPAAE